MKKSIMKSVKRVLCVFVVLNMLCAISVTSNAEEIVENTEIKTQSTVYSEPINIVLPEITDWMSNFEFISNITGFDIDKFEIHYNEFGIISPDPMHPLTSEEQDEIMINPQTGQVCFRTGYEFYANYFLRVKEGVDIKLDPNIVFTITYKGKTYNLVD